MGDEAVLMQPVKATPESKSTGPVSANPRIPTISPALRGTSYAGTSVTKSSTILKGMWRCGISVILFAPFLWDAGAAPAEPQTSLAQLDATVLPPQQRQ